MENTKLLQLKIKELRLKIRQLKENHLIEKQKYEEKITDLEFDIMKLNHQIKEELCINTYNKKINNANKKIKIDISNIGTILEDFIIFCVDLKKGHKFGVGEYHISKYLQSRKFE